MKLLSTIIATLAALVLLASAYGGYCDPRTWAIPAVLTLAMPIVVVGVLLVAALCLLLRQ